MRELKFRAWNGEAMIFPYYINRTGTAYWKENSILCATNDVMQYVGIKDCKGKDYYFDDIVKTKQGIGVLVWFDDRLGLASGEIGNYHATDQTDKLELQSSEIIGNIHEHPELI
jgi:hypothetical protein